VGVGSFGVVRVSLITQYRVGVGTGVDFDEEARENSGFVALVHHRQSR
jgi:hypothetical protein